MAKNYFAILGVTLHSSPEEIRSAFRRLAKEFHPDHFEGGSGPFMEIQEAYSIIGNAGRRHQYERSLQRARSARPSVATFRPAPEPLVPTQRPVNLGEISPVRSFQTFTPSFDEIFDWLWNNFSGMQWPKSGRVQQLTLEVPLTRAQALQGGNARVMVPARAPCPVCMGSGNVDYYECIRCGGEGAITGEIPISVSFPAGLISDLRVAVPLGRFGIRHTHLTVWFRVRDI